MSEFKRGIKNPNFIKELIANKHWQQIIKDDDLFVAIRKEYINVYFYGQSIAKITFVKNKIKWTTHNKYLGLDEGGYSETGEYLDKLDELKQNAKAYGGKEKEQVKNHILKDKALCVLDVEVAFGREEGYGTRSIDYLVVEKNDKGKIHLVFYEAKHFDNPEISARENPKVFKQMEKYENALNDPAHKAEILNSYKTIFNNVLELNLGIKNNLVQLVGPTFDNVEIDSEPRLIIFEIASDKIDNIHIKKLKQRFGEKKLILKEKNSNV
ncbi:MAG: hypothetical protein ACYCZ2_07270 [Lutibacter sp.]